MLTFAVTHYNRFGMLLEAVAVPLEHPRVAEVVILDDASTDGSWEKLRAHFAGHPKVRLCRNDRNEDCYAAKAAAVASARHDWVVLFDSDNIPTEEYLDRIPRKRRLDTAYLPVFAMPEFDYREFAGLTVTRETVAKHLNRPMFLTALNTANHVVSRDAYLDVWDPGARPVTADSILMNARWLASGRSLCFVPGMMYHHRIHPGSHFVKNHTATLEKYKLDIEDQLRRMR